MDIINSSIAQPCYSAPEVTPTLEKTKRERGFYAMVPRIVIKDTRLTHAEKTLYMCLKDMCGDTGTCFRSMRTLAEETGISASSLSHMIPHLQELGYIHGEKKARGYGGPPIWHISIIDIWEENREYCAKNVQLSQTDESVVQNLGSVVQEMHKESEYCAKFGKSCANFTDRRRYTEEDTLEDTLEEEGEQQQAKTHARSLSNISSSLSLEDDLPENVTSFSKPPEQKETVQLTEKQRRRAEEEGRRARETEIWAIVEEGRKTTYSTRQRIGKKHTDGLSGLIEDGVADTTIRHGLSVLSEWEKEAFCLNAFYEWLPNLRTRVPGTVGRHLKAVVNGNNNTNHTNGNHYNTMTTMTANPDDYVNPHYGAPPGMLFWKGQLVTEDEAYADGYNGGFERYK